MNRGGTLGKTRPIEKGEVEGKKKEQNRKARAKRCVIGLPGGPQSPIEGGQGVLVGAI